MPKLIHNKKHIKTTNGHFRNSQVHPAIIGGISV